MIRIFPNRASVIRLLGALLMEFDEGWSTGKVYLDMTQYNKLKADTTDKRAQEKSGIMTETAEKAATGAG